MKKKKEDTLWAITSLSCLRFHSTFDQSVSDKINSGTFCSNLIYALSFHLNRKTTEKEKSPKIVV